MKLAPGAAMAMSQVIASEAPAPAATPLTAAMLGMRNAIRRRTVGLNWVSMIGPGSARWTRSGPGAKSNSDRSAPAQNPRPAPVITSARIAVLASAWSSAAHRSWCIWRLKLLSACGRLSVATATAPCSSYRTVDSGMDATPSKAANLPSNIAGPAWLSLTMVRCMTHTDGDTKMSYESIQVRTEGGKVGVVTLNRPKQLNALNNELMDELGAALKAFDADPAIGCMVITGSEKAFAAGADIGAMATYSFADVYKGDYITRNWELIRQVRKPVIAAVSGFALGGGCELAMMCDFIIAADNARFGQPEIKLGIIPGAGGTQRLPRAVGKAKAMDLALTGRMMDAAEAERAGLVSRVVALDQLMDETLAAALMICEFSQVAVMAAKESVNRAFEGGLSDGIMFERRMFHALFATEDQKEGMDAFVNKRKAVFKHQ